MKKIFHFTLMFSFLLIASQTMAQDGATTNGPVWRITYIKIKPGKGDRDASSNFVSSHLVREVAYNPVKPAASGN